MPAMAGCLEDNDVESISVNDIVVNPIYMVGGEFQPFVISAKRDISVFIPHMVIAVSYTHLTLQTKRIV